MNTIIKAALKVFPDFTYMHLYKRAKKLYTDAHKQRDELFSQLVMQSEGKRCLQIGARGQKFAPHWISCDLYDHSEIIDVHYDVMDLQFDDNEFDIVVCNAVLEHVPHPQKAILELYRVLKPGGQIWVEVPFNQPYHPSPADYWRVSPEGMQVWMQDFQQTACGLFKIHRSSLYTAVFFLGVKQ